MKKYEFDYRVISVSGKVAVGKLKAIHERSARRVLKVKYPMCNILEVQPHRPTDQYGKISKNLW